MALLLFLTFLCCGMEPSIQQSPCDLRSESPRFELWARTFQVPIDDSFQLLRKEDLDDYLFSIGQEIKDRSGMISNGTGRWYLATDFPFYLHQPKATVEAEIRILAIDSFVDLYDAESSRIYRIVNMGSTGLIHDAFWVSPGCFMAVGVDEREGVVVMASLDEWMVSFYSVPVRLTNGGQDQLEDYLLSVRALGR